MADYSTQLLPSLSSQTGASGDRVYVARGTTASTARVAPPDPTAGLPSLPFGGVYDSTLEYLSSHPALDFSTGIVEGPSGLWFQNVHIFPVSLHLGNMVSTIVRQIEVYNSYRETSQDLDSVTNNAGTGITFQNLPSFPAAISPNGGIIFQVTISQQGQPTIDGTIDAETSVGDLSIPVTGSRIVMMAHEPEGNVQETLRFYTDISRSINGKEQRVRVRYLPRQIIDYTFKIIDQEERRQLETFLFKWHPQIFGIPVWFEQRGTTAAVTAGDSVIYLNTAYGDFRVGSLVIIWQDYETFDTLEISVVNPTNIVLTSPVSRDYNRGAKVAPVRTAVTKQEISGDKYPVNLHQFAVKFFVVDNDVDYSNDTAFSSHNGKVMFDDYNWISRETVTDTLKNVIHRTDNISGNILQTTSWENSHMVTSKGFFCRNAQATREMREILYFLAGRQKSFYLPTFYPDIILSQDIGTGETTMDIELMGYTDFIKGNEPNKSLRMVLNDGTILTRQVTGYVVLNDTEERLTVDVAWPQDIAVADVRIISFNRLGRFEDDTFVINHNNSGQAMLRATVAGVLQ